MLSKAADVLSLLPPDEQTIIRAKYFIHDAKLSLVSALLKRTYVSRCLEIPWPDVRYTRLGDTKHGKPAALAQDSSLARGIDFNISHQASLVALIGYCDRTSISHVHPHHTPSSTQISTQAATPEVSVGVDIVCVNERDDWRRIESEGWEAFIDTYDAVFSPSELWEMKYSVDSLTLRSGQVLRGSDIGRADRCVDRHEHLSVEVAGETVQFQGETVLEAKLRRFYAFFAYKEAFVKVSGEALLADWLRECEFHHVRSPRAGTVPKCSMQGVWGEKVLDAEVSMQGKMVEGVKLCIQGFEENHMIATAVQGLDSAVALPEFELLDLDNDLLVHAQK